MKTLGYPKSGVSPSQDRARRRRLTSLAERDAMQEVRARDRGCRFPLCGCRGLFAVHVCHLVHRGMGGNPTGDRTDPARLISLCAWRHLLGRVSLDKHTVQIVPLTQRGMDGPCKFLIHSASLPMFDLPGQFWEVGREVRRGECAPFSGEQAVVLDWLASMKV